MKKQEYRMYLESNNTHAFSLVLRYITAHLPYCNFSQPQ